MSIKAYVTGALFAVSALAAEAQEVTLDTAGADEDLADLLRQTSLTLAIDPEGDSVPQDYVAAARADYRALLTALYAKGYYGGTISIRVNGQEADRFSPLDAPAQINRIAIVVDPGPLFTFGVTEVTPLAPGTELPDGFATGEPAEAAVITDAARAGVDGWRDVGHAKARVSAENIVARHPGDLLDARVTLAPGPRLTFGPLRISGNEAVRTEAIRRIAGLPVGEVFSPAELEKAARRLRETGAFDSVALREAEAIGPGDTLPIDALIDEALPRRFGFGLELSSVEGLKVSTFWMHRNAFGGAERFRVEGEVAGIGGGTGGVDYRLNTSLNIPAIYGPDTDLLATAQISREDEPDYLLDSISAEVIVTRLILDDLEVSAGLGLLVAREESDLGTRDYALLTAPLGLTWDKRDSETNAKNGYYVELDATPFLSIDGGANGARLYADARAYLSFGEDDRITLAGRGQVGSVVGAEILEAPADFLFFSGGSGTVRGQEYKSLGITRDIGGNEVTTGGLSFAGAQLEARYGVTESIGVVGFYDIGFVGSTEIPGEDGEWHAGVGLGVRYDTGIGPIRLDIATPANGDDAFSDVQIYIGIGQAF